MKAQVLYGINDLRYEENFPSPILKEGCVLVRVKACGICGSDVTRVLATGAYFSPAILGHEFSGVVEKVSDTLDSHLIGKKVAVFPLIPCQKCASCHSGNYQLCESYDYIGSRCHGGFAEFVVVPRWNLLVIPDDITLAAAAMLEPAAVALHSLRLAGNILGKKVLITGTGTIASILCQLAVAGGASAIIVLGRNQGKLNYLKEKMPAISVVSTDDLSFAVETKLDNCADYVIEGTGAPEMIELAIKLVRRKGTVVLLGNPSCDVGLSKECFWQILRKEMNLQGTWNSSFGIKGKSDWDDALDLMRQGKVDMETLITHAFPLTKLLNGIELMTDRNTLSNKIMVVFDEK